jgi:hypothetical protein
MKCKARLTDAGFEGFYIANSTRSPRGGNDLVVDFKDFNNGKISHQASRS